MNSRGLCLLALLALLAILAGCGGGSGTVTTTGVGTAVGRINVAGGTAAGYKLMLDNQVVAAGVGSDGSFRLPNIPVGSHVLQVYAPDGMTGGRATFSVSAGAQTTIPTLDVTLGGQIAGMVTKLDGGVRTPLAGVQVTARTGIIPMLSGGAASGGAATPMPTIYPPPPEQSYTAVTDDTGSYLMKAVVPGMYLVTVAVPGLTTGEVFVNVTAGATSVADFTLTPVVAPGVGTIQGTVRGQNGALAPVLLAGALVTVTPNMPWEPPIPITPVTAPSTTGGDTTAVVMPIPIIWNAFTTLTDDSGHYSLNVPTGSMQISVSDYPWAGETRIVEVNDGAVLTEDFMLTTYPPPPVITPMGKR